MTEGGADEGDGEKNHAGENVAAVKAGDEIKCARVGGVPEDEPLVDETRPSDAEVLFELTGEKENAAEDGEGEKNEHLLALVLHRGRVREHHGDAGADEQEG